jgi:hypothetical protein
LFARVSFVDRLLVLIVFGAFCVACSSTSSPETAATWWPELDSAIRPQDDFFRYVNQPWLSKPALVPGQVVGSPRATQEQQVRAQLLQQLLAVESDGSFPEGTDQRKAFNFFKWASDSVAARQGMRAIQGWLQQIRGMKTEADFLRVVRTLQGTGVSVFFETRDVTPTQVAIWPLSRDARAPFRPWVFPDERPRVQIIKAALERLGVLPTESARKAAEIEGLEVALDEAFVKPAANVAVRPIAYVAQTTFVSWDTFFRRDPKDSIRISQPAYWQLVNQFIAATTNLERKKDFLTWRVLAATAPFLGPEWLPVLYGARSVTWRFHCLELTRKIFPDVFARMYVRGHSGLARKAAMEDLVENVRLALASKIKETTRWPDSVKGPLLGVLAANRVSLLPDRPYESYQGLRTDREANQLWAEKMLALIVQPSKLLAADTVLRWQPYSTEVQLISHGRILVPLALTEPPFFTEDAAWNYGALGIAISRALLQQLPLPWVDEGALEVNMVDVAYRAWQRHRMEADVADVRTEHFFVALAYHHREVSVADPAVAAERAAQVFDVLSSFPAFYETFQITERDKMFREPKYRTPIW